MNNNIGKPVFFPNTTILIGNIIIPSGLTLADCTITTGGFVKLGKLIVVNIRITSSRTQSFGRLITGFPTPVVGYVAVTGFNNTKKSSVNGIIDGSGNLWIGTEINDDIILSATYKI